MTKRILVGTCGFSRARHLIYKHLDVVEIQQTFYDPRPPEAFAKYRREAPENFEFTVKAWMLITHTYNPRLWRRLKEDVPGDRARYGGFQDTREVWWAWEQTREAAKAVGARIIVFQTPASFRYSQENLERARSFFSRVKDEFVVAWEPRGDWWTLGLESLAALAGEGIVIVGDYLRGRLPPRPVEPAYTRLHGLGGGEVNYRYKYTDSDLERLREIIENIESEAVYVLFNNVYSFDDAVRFKKLLGGGGP